MNKWHETKKNKPGNRAKHKTVSIQWIYSDFCLFSWKQLPAAESQVGESDKTKTMGVKMLKGFVEQRGTAEMGDNISVSLFLLV